MIQETSKVKQMDCAKHKEYKFQSFRIFWGKKNHQTKMLEDSNKSIKKRLKKHLCFPRRLERMSFSLCFHGAFRNETSCHSQASQEVEFPQVHFPYFLRVAMRAFWIRRMAPGWHVSTLKAKSDVGGALWKGESGIVYNLIHVIMIMMIP